jgi:hypothetical protein
MTRVVVDPPAVGESRAASMIHAQQGLRQAGVEEGFRHGSVDQFAIAKQGGRGAVGEAYVALGVDQQEGVAQGIEQAVALVQGLLEFVLHLGSHRRHLEFSPADCLLVPVAEACDGDCGRDERGDEELFQSHALAFAMQ